MTTKRDPIYAGHRFPAEVIAHAVWPYFRFPLSLRMVEEMLAARGVDVSHETIRSWALKSRRGLSQRHPSAVAAGGRQMASGRGHDRHCRPEALALARRRSERCRPRRPRAEPARAAKRLLRKLLKRQTCTQRVMITDKLRSNGAAAKSITPGVEHRQHKGLNNRAGNSHRPTRRRERIMKRFKSPKQAQRFLATHEQVANLFKARTTANADDRRQARRKAHHIRAEISRVAAA